MGESRNERIKDILKDLKISYTDVATQLGITKAAVSERLNKEKEIEDKKFIETISRITGVPKDALLTGENLDEIMVQLRQKRKTFNVFVSHSIDDIESYYKKLYEEAIKDKARLEEKVMDLEEKLALAKEAISAWKQSKKE